jgi:hypothetical protein
VVVAVALGILGLDQDLLHREAAAAAEHGIRQLILPVHLEHNLVKRDLVENTDSEIRARLAPALWAAAVALGDQAVHTLILMAAQEIVGVTEEPTLSQEFLLLEAVVAPVRQILLSLDYQEDMAVAVELQEQVD